ncbi:hypothetical protein DPMN_143954 [Dreissena polymorpha]|uniref:Retrotransposon gag domain-containing protein n=1 Tax=Dreissena polymorpha TaxID=45954 RepID=A0A9D4GDS4_DREPO|nr:hypothetical protein DPMN_143954 [Dreissena polymorpha]
MNSRFRVIETPWSFAAKFSRRAQRHGETVEEFAADLKMLYDRAHRCRDRQTREEDLVRRFLDGLYDEKIKFEVEFNKEPRTVDEAVYNDVNLMQIRNGSRNDRKWATQHTPSIRNENGREAIFGKQQSPPFY